MMKRSRMILAGAALLVGLLGACSQNAGRTCAADSKDAAALEAEVRALFARQREGWNRGDLDAFLADYEPSEALLFTSGAKIRRGFAETETSYRTRYGGSREGMGTLAFELLDVRLIGACSDGAVVLGEWRLTDTDEAGHGVFSVILERREGAWRIVHDHTSAAAE